MDSINRNQPEENHEDLSGAEAGSKIKQLAEKASACFFCTRIRSGAPVKVRPMSIRKVDENGDCWFLSADDSHKNSELADDPSMQIMLQGSAHSDFLTLFGTASISRDREKIKELWAPLVKAWFTEGVDDPRITVIRFTPSDGYYWDTKHGGLVAFVKIAVSAATGTTMDDSIEGKVRP
jgi:general stress protein 26